MYDDLINKMNRHFSNVGSIIYSKACDFSKLHPISIEDIEIYYDLLCSDEVIPEHINRKNHTMCCLFYLSKDNPDYTQVFTEKFLETIDIDKIEKNSDNLVMVFNIIEFDKTYLHSTTDAYSFLYTLLKIFSNFETDLKNFVIYKYYRGYLKLKLGDLEQANREYLEIVSEVIGNEDFIMKYIKLLSDLLKVKINHVSQRVKRADFHENIQFLEDLFNEVKDNNKVLALKIGFDLYSAYLEGQDYYKCIPHLTEMKKLLKKGLLRGSSMKNGIDFYLAIASRMGYIGILLNHKPSIQAAIRKIKKALGMLGNESNDKKISELIKGYKFYLANLEISLNQKTEDILYLAGEFKEALLPELKSKALTNNIVTENNKDSIIIDLKIINNMNKDIYDCSKKIMEFSHKSLMSEKNANNTNFTICLSSFHDKIFRYSESFITDRGKSEYYKERIKEYFKLADEIIKKYIDNQFFQTAYAKILVINIYSVYANILLIENDVSRLKKVIDDIMDNKQSNLRSKLKIDDKFPSYGLWLKIKGDYYLQLKHFEAAINSYENAIENLKENHPKVPLILFNCGCAYYFKKDKKKSIEFLSRAINGFCNLNYSDNYFGYKPKPEDIKKKIETARSLIEVLQREK